MKKPYWIGAGALAVVTGAALFAMQPDSQQTAPPQQTTHADSDRAPSARAAMKLAKVAPAARQDINYAALDRRIRELMEQPSMVGMAVGVVENGRITFLKGYGETLAGSGEQVTPQTVFRWASLSKGVAGTMIGQLAAQGKLSFHSPLAQYAASLKLPGGAEHRATVGDMLSHRLGLYRNAYDNKLEEGQRTPFLRQTLSQLNLICPPGTCWSYQNVAFDGSSEIVEQLTGRSYEEALRNRLFNPLGMTSASASMEGLMNSPAWARPHGAGRRELELNDNYYRVPAAGGVNSNIKDLSLWMIAQMGGMPDVLPPDLLETIQAPLVQTPTERRRMRKFLERVGDPHYGYGWRSYDYAGHRIIGHHGGVSGYRALILFDPAKKSGVVAMWNSNTSRPFALEFEVMDMIYGLPFRDWLELGAKKTGEGQAEDQESIEESAEDTTAAVAAAANGLPGRG